jgi:hypothetical protein
MNAMAVVLCFIRVGWFQEELGQGAKNLQSRSPHQRRQGWDNDTRCNRLETDYARWIAALKERLCGGRFGQLFEAQSKSAAYVQAGLDEQFENQGEISRERPARL